MTKITPLSETAVLVDLGSVISVELNQHAIAICRQLQERPFPGFIECAPAYASVSVHFDLATVRRAFPDERDAFSAVSNFLLTLIDQAEDSLDRNESRLVEIAADFAGEAAPDLAEAADILSMAPERLIEIFLERTYRVFMLGFMPGFPYMGEVDERIALPRRTSPRTCVKKGSIGIAGRQTGIYPQDSPGGWQIIGHTSVELFDPERRQPCLLEPGDSVRFVRR